jgi:hypothetical protein
MEDRGKDSQVTPLMLVTGSDKVSGFHTAQCVYKQAAVAVIQAFDIFFVQ